MILLPASTPRMSRIDDAGCGVVTAVIDGGAEDAMSLIVPAWSSETLPWPGIPREETFAVVTQGDQLLCLAERLGGDELAASARIIDGRVQWEREPEPGRRGEVIAQLIVGTAQLRGMLHELPPEATPLRDGEVRYLPSSTDPTTAYGSWHVHLGDEIWRLWEGEPLGARESADPRARQGILVADSEWSSSSLTNLDYIAAGRVMWTSPSDVRYWPTGTHPGLDEPLTDSSLPAPLHLIAAHCSDSTNS